MLAEDRTARGRTLADIVVHLKCHACSARPMSVHLTENGYAPDVKGNLVPGWNLLLHGTEAGMDSTRRLSVVRASGSSNVA